MLTDFPFVPGVWAISDEPQLAPFATLDRWPTVTKFRSQADGIEVRHILIHKARDAIREHAHKFPHLTIISAGAVRVWLDGVLQSDIYAPGSLYIGAGTRHLIMALADDTALQCIHNVSRSGEIEIEGEA